MSDHTILGMNQGQQVLAAFITSVGLVIAGLVAVLGRRVSTRAEDKKADADVTTAVASAWATYGEQLALDRAADRKRIADLEGRVASMEQHIASLENLLRKHGIDIPHRMPVEPYLMLDSSKNDTPPPAPPGGVPKKD